MTETGALAVPVGGRGWESAVVVERRPENAAVVTLRLRLDSPLRFLPGQHAVIRLTAPDGYTAQRSYSIASAPDLATPDEFEVTIERLPDGEVSGFLHGGVEVGDALEVRVPIGGWFVWDGSEPATLIGGGSGVVPLMSMLRSARRLGHTAALLVSYRNALSAIYLHELADRPDATVLYSRAVPAGWARPAGRLTANDIAAVLLSAGPVFVCGSSGFVTTATDALNTLGVEPSRIRIERFGPT